VATAGASTEVIWNKNARFQKTSPKLILSCNSHFSSLPSQCGAGNIQHKGDNEGRAHCKFWGGQHKWEFGQEVQYITSQQKRSINVVKHGKRVQPAAAVVGSAAGPVLLLIVMQQRFWLKDLQLFNQLHECGPLVGIRLQAMLRNGLRGKNVFVPFVGI